MESDPEPQEITTLVGREVYSISGTFVGDVDDVRLDLDTEAVTGLALGGVNDEVFKGRTDGARGAILPYRWVRAVGDIILVSDTIDRLKESDEEEEIAAD